MRPLRALVALYRSLGGMELLAAAAAVALALLLARRLLGEPASGALPVLGTAALVVSLVLLALWWRRRATLSRRLSRLTAEAGRLAAGERGARVTLPRERELLALASHLNLLAERLGGQVAALEVERNHYRELLDAMSDGVLEADAQGYVGLVNPAFCRLFGVERPRSRRTVRDLTRRPELADLVEQALAGEAPPETEVALGGGRVAQLAGVQLEQGGALVLARDVTDRIRFDNTRREFVANISHELKTPLTAIRGYAETLLEGAADKPEVAARFTTRILAQCSRLEALLADLLALSRLESGVFRGDENREPVSLEELCRRALEVVARVAEEREVRLELDAARVPPVIGYPEALERLMQNLLDNAIKYNRRGGWVKVSLACRGRHAVLEVADSGIGIPEKTRDRVFERFYRVDRGRAREEGGTGLGLALVKHAAMRHGGTVEVESDLGKGSTFRVLLPLADESSGEPLLEDELHL